MKLLSRLCPAIALVLLTVGARAADEFDFSERLQSLNEELEALNVDATALEGEIAENVERLLEAIR